MTNVASGLLLNIEDGHPGQNSTYLIYRSAAPQPEPHVPLQSRCASSWLCSFRDDDRLLQLTEYTLGNAPSGVNETVCVPAYAYVVALTYMPPTVDLDGRR